MKEQESLEKKREGQFQNVEEDSDEDDENVEYLRNKVYELEQARLDLVDKIEANKEKARQFLMQKDMQTQRLKMVLLKVENQLKIHYNLSQEEINKMATLKEEEVARMLNLEKELD